MTTRIVSVLPPQVEERIAAMIADGRSGEVVIRIHDGRILSAKANEDIHFRDA